MVNAVAAIPTFFRKFLRDRRDCGEELIFFNGLIMMG
jgi:hypothetical protein